MKNNDLIFKLIELGLTEKEALVYQAALKLGPSTAQLLSLESGIKRATVYSCIATLIEKSLLHVEVKGVRKLFIAESPEKLAILLEKKKQILTNIIPQLMQDYLHSKPSDNSIKMYHGLTAIKLLYDDILNSLKSGDEYLVISDQKKWYELDPVYFEEFKQKRAAINLDIKLILQDNHHSKSFKEKGHQYNEKIKFLPEEMNLNINMIVFHNKVLIIQTVEPLVAVVIENSNIAAMNRILFNTIWGLLS